MKTLRYGLNRPGFVEAVWFKSGLTSSSEWMSGDTTLSLEPAIFACQINGLWLK